MRQFTILLSIVFITVAAAPSYAGKCSGDKNCTACKNCKYCKNCSQNGGTCGVCKPAAKSKSRKMEKK